MKHWLHMPICIGFLWCVASCGERSSEVALATNAEDAGQTLDAWFTESAPPEAMAIHLARKSATPGDTLTLTGRVMGRAQPFVEGRAAFVLGDPELLTPCNEKPDDGCPTPWDTCCDTAEAKREGTATIQISGEDGRVLPHTLRGIHGLTELSTVTVQGKVATGSDGEVLIVNATSIHVHP